MLKRYKAIISYDGSCFIGWQKQVEGLSVQSAMEEVLTRMHKKHTQVVASGRTDKGVSAKGQVCHFESELNIEVEKFRRALNAQLHEGIYIHQLEVVDSHFHSRIDAQYKIYLYRIGLGEMDIFRRNQVWFTKLSLDICKMREAAQYLIGTHDFSSFNTNSFVETPDQVRTIFDIQIYPIKDEIHLKFIGSGFLRYMVRMMTQTLIEVGSSKIEPIKVKEFLEAKDKEVLSLLAKPQGLTLMKVGYEPYQAELTESLQ